MKETHIQSMIDDIKKDYNKTLEFFNGKVVFLSTLDDREMRKCFHDSTSIKNITLNLLVARNDFIIDELSISGKFFFEILSTHIESRKYEELKHISVLKPTNKFITTYITVNNFEEYVEFRSILEGFKKYMIEVFGVSGVYFVEDLEGLVRPHDFLIEAIKEEQEQCKN